MPQAATLADRRYRTHLYEMAYWALANYAAVAVVSPRFASDSLFSLLFLAAGLCAALCVLLSPKLPAHDIAPSVRTPAPLPASEQALRVEIERMRRKAGSFAAILLQMNRGSVELSRKDYHSALQSASELLHRYLEDNCTVVTLQGDRIAAILPQAGAFEVERLLDRLKEDLRGWSRFSTGVGLTAGVVIDRNTGVGVDAIVRDLSLAVRRAAVYNRDRFVISEG